MVTGENFDVIIAGGGPAGLAIASELSASCTVLVLEKNVAGATDRFWFVPPDVLDGLTTPYSYGGVTRFLTKTYSMHGDDLAWRAKLFPSYPYIKDHDILRFWAEKIRANGAQILDHCSYLDHTVSDDGVTVTTSAGTFHGRLLIDCTGYDSPIVAKYEFDRSDFYWWSVFGAIGTHPDGLGQLQVGDYMIWQTFADYDQGSLNKGTPVFEYEVLDQRTSFPLVLYLRQERVDKESMKKVFYDMLRNQGSTPDFHTMEVESERWGWYPSGGLNQQIAAERVAFAGDSACWTTPCGWGMTFILDNYRHFAEKIAECLQADTLDEESLLAASHYRLHDKFEITTNVLATHFLANASTDQLDRFIRLFQRDVDPILCEKVFTLMISQDEILGMLEAVLKEFSIPELCGLIPAVGLVNLFKEVRYFAGDFILDGLRALFHAHPDKENGFDFEDEGMLPG
jgi:flavin-dependent dehydrogenase